MWFRPRTEVLPSDSRWWEFNDDPKWSALAVSLGFIGLCYCICALVGWLRVRPIAGSGLLLLFVALRSGFLGTLENPEPRYTLEMYPDRNHFRRGGTDAAAHYSLTELGSAAA